MGEGQGVRATQFIAENEKSLRPYLSVVNLQNYQTMETLLIQENTHINLKNYGLEFQLEISEYLGLLNTDIHYFKVKIINPENEEAKTTKFGLLRIGSLDSGLARELELRKSLDNYGMISKLLGSTTVDDVIIQFKPELNKSHESQDDSGDLQEVTESLEVLAEDNIVNEGHLETVTENQPESEALEEEYLEEEYYPSKEFLPEESTTKLLLLTYFPETENNLSNWLLEENDPAEYLAIVIQVCQCFFYLSQKGWYYLDILPQFITLGKPITFYDLTNIYPRVQELTAGFLGSYTAPELAYQKTLNETVSTYTIGALIYQCFHKKQLVNTSQANADTDLDILPLPLINQILTIALSPIPEERFSLDQLLKILVNARNQLRQLNITWEIGSKSTVGLSRNRLVNEDNYGFKQEKNSYLGTTILAALADGMGGMSQGELASKLAIEKALSIPFEAQLNLEEIRKKYLEEIFTQANYAITQQVNNGGTTLSTILAINEKLTLAHVGDSRIYLLRNNLLQQLSEDHSYVAILVASGQINYEESLTHPDRNILVKSLGSKPNLSQGYVQYDSMILEDQDILILCSDGVWDLLDNQELCDLFSQAESLDGAVNQAIRRILEKGATDNGTIIALKCSISQAQI